MKKLTFVFLVSLIALAFLVAPVSAKTIRTEYTGSEECGDVIMSDARVWFSDGGLMHVRNGGIECTDIVDDDRITGEVFVTVNWNFKFTPQNPYGPMWGTIRLDNEGGYWEGTWVGEITELEGYSYIYAVMRGFGDYEGLQARATYFKDSPSSSTYQVTGFIMNPGGK